MSSYPQMKLIMMFISGDGSTPAQRRHAVTITGKLSTVRSPTRTRHTAQADIVREALAESGTFRSAQEVYARLRGGGHTIGLSTVYRHLQSLAEQGLADVIVNPGGEATYRFCQTQGTHHHHLVCRQCGRAEEVEGRAVERWAAAVAAQHGFTEVDHTLEVFGTCAKCANNSS